MKTKSKVQVHSGGRKVVQGPKQKEAHHGREQNQRHKAAFSAGAFAKNDPNAGRPNGPLLPDSKVAVRPAGTKAEARS